MRPEFLGSRAYLIGVIRLHVNKLLSRINVFGFLAFYRPRPSFALLSFPGIDWWRGHLELNGYVTLGVDPLNGADVLILTL